MVSWLCEIRSCDCVCRLWFLVRCDLVACLGFLVSGFWFMVFGLWFLVYVFWFMVSVFCLNVLEAVDLSRSAQQEWCWRLLGDGRVGPIPIEKHEGECPLLRKRGVAPLRPDCGGRLCAQPSGWCIDTLRSHLVAVVIVRSPCARALMRCMMVRRICLERRTGAGQALCGVLRRPQARASQRRDDGVLRRHSRGYGWSDASDCRSSPQTTHGQASWAGLEGAGALQPTGGASPHLH